MAIQYYTYYIISKAMGKQISQIVLSIDDWQWHFTLQQLTGASGLIE